MKQDPKSHLRVVLAGNPNVGKSTVFNRLTGLRQHTGNWPGKTVDLACGEFVIADTKITLTDLPGCYSLSAHSAEEEISREVLCSGDYDRVVVVCDATCLERNLHLVLQILEITSRVILCVNLLDEAEKKKVHIDLERLQTLLGIPVVGVTARNNKGLKKLCHTILTPPIIPSKPAVRYLSVIEQAIAILTPHLSQTASPRYAALRILQGEEPEKINTPDFAEAYKKALSLLNEAGITQENLPDRITGCALLTAESICLETVFCEREYQNQHDRRLDRFFLGKYTGIPIMLLLLCLILWLTLSGANTVSNLLSAFLFSLGDRLSAWMGKIGAPTWLEGILIQGGYRVLAWVVAVMLPPMAIFFPLFTLLEDYGYLPRVAFQLDHAFQKANACGKQALTMCMGFGCNAVGVVGCRIMDSPRERLIAILTNSFMPCNGRFPLLLSMLLLFFSAGSRPGASLLSSVLLTGIILIGVFITFFISRVLSVTLLRGTPSAFALELPPYRRPQVGRVLIRSILDRTIVILGRAAAVAAPAGVFIWLLANLQIDGQNLLILCADFLDPVARWLGMDGAILLAFILALPANEIVLPILLMIYLGQGSLTEVGNLMAVKEVLTAHGWTWVTALSVILFSLCHWPCSTTCLTIKKETGSIKWTALAILLPTVTGVILCFLLQCVVRLFG